MNKKEMNNLLFAKLYEQKFHRKNGTNASIMYEKNAHHKGNINFTHTKRNINYNYKEMQVLPLKLKH